MSPIRLDLQQLFLLRGGIGISSAWQPEKAMAPHSSTLAWKIPWTEEPGRLQSMESLRVRLDWMTSLSLFTFMHWKRKWQPTPVFLPGESQGQGSLVGCHLWGRRVRHDWSDLAAAAWQPALTVGVCTESQRKHWVFLNVWLIIENQFLTLFRIHCPHQRIFSVLDPNEIL